MVQRLRFLPRQRQYLLHPRRVGNVADHFRLRPRPDLLLDFHPHSLEIEPHLLEDVDGHALPQLDQAEQQMLGPDVIMIEAIGFFSSESQDLLGPRSEIIHWFGGSGVDPFSDSFATLVISGLGNTRKRSRMISARKWSRSSAFSFCCELFCKWAGCVSMNNSSIGNRRSSGNAPRSMPSFMIDNKLSASFEVIACAKVSTP